MALVGYARVSSIGQTLDVQLDKLKHCHKVFQEKLSATSAKRSKLRACLEYVREGDGVLSGKPRNVRKLFEFSQTTVFDKDIENLVTSIDV